MEKSTKTKRPYKKRKLAVPAVPALGESKSFTKKREFYVSRSKDVRPEQPPSLFGQPIDGQWVHTANGWVRRGHSQVNKLPLQQISRYFKITKILEEVDPWVPTDKDGNLPKTMEEYNEFLKQGFERSELPDEEALAPDEEPPSPLIAKL